MQRQPIHDFGLEISKADGIHYVRLIFPNDFDRPHLGSINIMKAAMEAAVEINTQNGLENTYSKKLLGTFFLRLKEEITGFDNVVIEMRITKTKKRNGTLWQRWSLKIGSKNRGYFWACYLP